MARKLRRDAELNHERIVESARSAFAEHGLDAAVEEIARGAGVGMGTLYRHFPSKDALIDAIFESALDRVGAVAREALEMPDAWEGFTNFVTRTVEFQEQSRGLAEVLATRREAAASIERKRARLQPLVRKLLARAQEQGALRPDFSSNDMSELFAATARIVETTSDSAPGHWRRFVGFLLDGLRAERAGEPAPPAS